MWVRFLGQEDPLEKGMATHSSILALEIPWREEPGELQSLGSQRVVHAPEQLNHRHHSSPLWRGFEYKVWDLISVFCKLKTQISRSHTSDPVRPLLVHNQTDVSRL